MQSGFIVFTRTNNRVLVLEKVKFKEPDELGIVKNKAIKRAFKFRPVGYFSEKVLFSSNEHSARGLKLLLSHCFLP